MPGVLLPRKPVRNGHKKYSVTRLIVKLVAENLRSLAEVGLVSFDRSSARINARVPSALMLGEVPDGCINQE